MAGKGYQVFGSFKDRDELQNAVSSFSESSFRNDQISILISDTSIIAGENADFTANEGDFEDENAGKGAAAGLGTGAVVGGVFGWLVGLGALTIPGFGPFVAAGPLASLLVGAAAGGTLGGVSGALLGLGLSEDDARTYEQRFHAGEAVMSISCDNASERDRALSMLKKLGAGSVSAVNRPNGQSRTVESAGQAAAATEASQTAAYSAAEPLSSQIEVTHESIERRAYEIWEREGHQPGHDMEYWTRAESELKAH